MSNYESRPERRQDSRVTPKGTVIIRAQASAIRGRVADLSHCGLSAIIDGKVPAEILDGMVDLELRLDGREASWLELRGHVVRTVGTTLAFEFDGVPAAFAQIIDQTLSAGRRHSRTLSIVLVDATLQRRHAMSEGFRSAGCGVIDVSTPLEAIVRLGESDFEPDLIAIADSVPTGISDELRNFVRTAHPDARLVTIGDATTAPAGLALWLSAANPAGDLAARIRKVLTTLAPD